MTHLNASRIDDSLTRSHYPSYALVGKHAKGHETSWKEKSLRLFTEAYPFLSKRDSTA